MQLWRSIVTDLQKFSRRQLGKFYVGVGRINGRCEIREGTSGNLVGIVPGDDTDSVDDSLRNPVRVHVISQPSSVVPRAPALLSCLESGLLRVHAPVVGSQLGSDNIWQESFSWRGPAAVTSIAVDESELLVAFACQGSELSVWDIQTKERVYLAKGAKPDKIGLMEKPWNTAIAFLPGSESTKIVVGTAKHKVRVYDISQRRPKLSVDFGETRITAVVPEKDGQKVWVGNALGQISCLDLQLGKMQRVLKGSGGSARSLAIHPEAPLLISAGLDRFLRLHHTESGKLLSRFYLKQNLVSAVFCPDVMKQTERRDDTAEDLKEVPEEELPDAAAQEPEERNRKELSESQESEGGSEQDLPPPPVMNPSKLKRSVHTSRGKAQRGKKKKVARSSK